MILARSVILALVAAWFLAVPQYAVAQNADPRCYDSTNAGSVGAADWAGCAGLYIIADLAELISARNNNYTINHSDGNDYTFEDSAFNIFTGQVTSMVDLFRINNFDGDIGYWDTSNVTTMEGMFQFNRFFNSDISSWDTGNVTDMSIMFADADAFNQDIGVWDTSNVENMSGMFAGNEAFNRNIGSWDTSNVTDMLRMFADSFFVDGGIGNWDTSRVQNMFGMFSGNVVFNGDISGWDTSNATDMRQMFDDARRFNRDISGWNVRRIASEPFNFDRLASNQWTNDEKPFWGSIGVASASSVQAISADGTYYVDDTVLLSITFDRAVRGADGVVAQLALNNGGVATYVGGSGNTVEFSYTVGAGEEIDVLDFASVDALSPAGAIVSAGGGTPAPSQLELPTPNGAGSISDGATLVITGERPADCYDSINAGIIGRAGWLGDCEGLYIVADRAELIAARDSNHTISHTDGNDYTFGDSAFNIFTGQVTDMSSLFSGTTFNQDIGYWDTSLVTNMDDMFNGASAFDQDISGWVVDQIGLKPFGFDDGTSDQWTLDEKPSWDQVGVIAVRAVDGTYGQGDQISITVDFERPISANGTPELLLNIGNANTSGSAIFFGQNDAQSLEFTYTVALGDFIDDLAYVDTNALMLPAGSAIVDADGIAVDLTLPTPGAANSLSANSVIAIDGRAPDCYDPSNAGTIGHADWNDGICAGLYIIADLAELISARNNNYTINHSDGNDYTFEDSAFNIFTGQVTSMVDLFRINNFDGDIGYWDTSNVTTMEGMFQFNRFFNSDISSWDTGNVTDMSIMFADADAFNQEIGVWDTSNVENMSGMFAGNEAFSRNIGSWDTSNVTDMLRMFADSFYLDGGIGNWDTSRVQNMFGVFSGNVVFNGDISGWDTSNATNMTQMFNGARRFNQDISGWNVRNIASEPSGFDLGASNQWTNDEKPFWGSIGVASASSVQAISADGTYYVDDRVLLSITFDRAVRGADGVVAELALNNGGVATYVGGSGNTVEFSYTVGAGEEIGVLDFASVDALSPAGAIVSAGGGTPAPSQLELPAPNGAGSISDGATLAITGERPADCYDSINAGIIGRAGWLGDCEGLYIVADRAELIAARDSNHTISHTDGNDYTFGDSAFNIFTGQVTDMSSLFSGTTFNQDIGYWDTSLVTNMDDMFNGASAFDQDISGWVVDQIGLKPFGFDDGTSDQWTLDEKPSWDQVGVIAVRAVDGTYGQGDQISITVDFERPISANGTPELLLNIGNANTSGSAIFSGQNDAQSLEFTYTVALGDFIDDLAYVDTNALMLPAGSAIVDADGIAVDLTLPTPGAANSLSANSVIAIDGRAPDCYDPSNAGTIGHADWNDGICAGLYIIADLAELISARNNNYTINHSDGNDYTFEDSAFNIFTGQVTSMVDLFRINNFDGDIGYWDTSNVTTMEGMFQFNRFFNSDISSWDTGNVTDMSIMFADADAFNQEIGVWDTSNVENMSGMFAGNEAFSRNIGSWDTSNVTDMLRMFADSFYLDGGIGNWDTSRVQNMFGVFSGNVVFNGDISGWDTSNATNMTQMFNGARRFNQDISGWNVRNIASETIRF